MEPAIELSRSATRAAPLSGAGTVAPAAASQSTTAAAAPQRARASQLAWTRACLTVDVLMLVTAAATAELGAARAGVADTPHGWLALFGGLAMGLLWGRGLYGSRLGLRLLDDVRAIVAACAIAAMTVAMVRALAFPDAAAADQALRVAGFSAVYLIGGRALLNWSELTARRRGDTLRPTLIIGAGHVGRLAAKRLLAHPELGMRPVGFLDKQPVAAERGDVDLPVLGASWDIEDVVRRHGVEQVIVTFSKAPHDVLLRLANRCEELGVQIAFVPRLFDRMTERVRVDHVGGLPLLTARLVNPKGIQFALKHVADRAVALLLLVLLAPLLLAASVAVRVSLGPGVLFRQTRIGRDGRRFEILKFRSMHPQPAARSFALELDSAPGGIEGVDRRTRVGELLRRTSIDELPQLLNVLKGEMSLIGPRPERPEFVELFSENVDRYDDRHRVRAGITGWAQVNGLRGKTSISERAELDNFYVQNWSLWLDLKILLMTVSAVLLAFRRVE